jgi:hypothetical protein
MISPYVYDICIEYKYVKNKMLWKNEPPYLATTSQVIFMDCDLVAIIYWQSLLSITITLGVLENTHKLYPVVLVLFVTPSLLQIGVQLGV